MPTTILLKDVPSDVYKKLIMEQAKEKVRKNRQSVSLSAIVFKMVKAYDPDAGWRTLGYDGNDDTTENGVPNGH